MYNSKRQSTDENCKIKKNDISSMSMVAGFKSVLDKTKDATESNKHTETSCSSTLNTTKNFDQGRQCFERTSRIWGIEFPQ